MCKDLGVEMERRVNEHALRRRHLRLLVCQPTFRYEESCVVEVRESAVVLSFSLFVAFLADDESCERAIHRVIGHLASRQDRTDE